MGLRSLWRRYIGLEEERSGGTYPLTLDQWASFFSYNGLQYPIGLQQTLVGNAEKVGGGFAGLVQSAYRNNGVVFACMLVRQLLFAEARFQFRQLRSGRPGDLFGTAELSVLERPWPGGTTGDLLTRAIQDADIGGNSFIIRQGPRLQRLRPDWMTIVSGSQERDLDAWDIGAEVIGYLYQPGGPGSGKDPVPLDVNDVAHFAPIPDPISPWRGMSWLEPVIREISADGAATSHKLKFFENGATPNMVVSLNPDITRENFELWVKAFEEKHVGVLNAYKTLYLGGGASATVVGADMRQLDFKMTQGAGETRIAAAAGVPPVIVGLSEGLQAATYSNYGQARRRFADGTMRPLWRNFAGSMARIIDVPAGSELWYDDRDIPFLAEDQKDAAEIQKTQAATIRQLIDAGYTPESVVDAVTSGDWSRLKHTHLFSVQLQPPQTSVLPPVGDQAGRALATLIGPYLNGDGEE